MLKAIFGPAGQLSCNSIDFKLGARMCYVIVYVFCASDFVSFASLICGCMYTNRPAFRICLRTESSQSRTGSVSYRWVCRDLNADLHTIRLILIGFLADVSSQSQSAPK